MSNFRRNLDVFQELSEHMTLRIGPCQHVAHDADWSEAKTHQDYDLWFVSGGRVDIRMQGKPPLSAGAGDVVFFHPDVPYAASAGPDGCEFIYVHFDFGIGERSHILEEFDLAGVVPGDAVREEVEWFRRSYRAYADRSALSRIRLRGSLTVLLAAMLEADARAAEGGPTHKKSASKGLDALAPVFDYIRRQPQRPIAIRELAEQAGMSEKYFISFFKRTVGVTPGKYLSQVRMNRARDYLSLTNYTIREISELLGYPDPYMFSKAFKKTYHVPPSKFR